MELIQSKQFDITQLNNINIDILICASGYEKRCTSFMEKHKVKARNKYVLSFSNFTNFPQRISNDKYFRKHDFNFIQLDEKDEMTIIKLLTDITTSLNQDKISVLIDYSSMTSIWYATILYFFKNYNLFTSVNVFFNYSYAKFTPAFDSAIQNKQIEPIQGYCNLSLPYKPTALILGLGYEKDKAFGLSEYLDAETYIFYTQSEIDNSEYSFEVERHNSDLIKIIKKENIIQYPIFNLDLTQNLLYQVCCDLKDHFRIILAPCGPKPFTLLCLIMSFKLESVDVWRVSSSPSTSIYDRESNGKFSIIECKFISE